MPRNAGSLNTLGLQEHFEELLATALDDARRLKAIRGRGDRTAIAITLNRVMISSAILVGFITAVRCSNVDLARDLARHAGRELDVHPRRLVRN